MVTGWTPSSAPLGEHLPFHGSGKHRVNLPARFHLTRRGAMPGLGLLSRYGAAAIASLH